MNLVWNTSLRRFEAQFSSDFQGDLGAVKSAKFKTDGPPGWTWWTQKASVLQALRTKFRPASGLTITEEALAIYQPMVEVEAKNEEIKKQYRMARKAAKKAALPSWLPPGKEYLTKEDLPPKPEWVGPFPKPPEPEFRCKICDCGLYIPDNIEDKVCLWCEKIFENKA